VSTIEVLRKLVEYRHDSACLEEVLVRNAATVGPAPTVIVCHGAEGRSDVLEKMAERVLPWGYQAFVMDLYGKGVSGSTPKSSMR
jgi:dienelactone hydrolase